MNRITLAFLATAAALTAHSASADTRVRIGIDVGHPAYCPPTVVYAPAPTVVYAPPAPRGYWTEMVVKTWVPERWVSSRDRWGRPVRICEPGYFAYRTDRVWVDDRVEPGRHAAAGYGYNHHRDDWRR